ncbi:MAG: hypothetical protein C0594_01115 [Marinilabiliales bacterium]|nr:MAG: hypothetical protein C0594_01115 [Marinilabiliales bacterium]
MVLAPADGIVEEIADGIPDNKIGDVNLIDNWGNTVVVKHSDYLFSSLSHLKAGTFKVKVGDVVKKGQVLALVGNSGRSPEPHLHMQLQSSKYIGSKTIDFPIAYYLADNGREVEFKSFSRPMKDETVSVIPGNTLVKNAFHFIPGKKLEFEAGNATESWEVRTNIYNQSFLFCEKTQSRAWFVMDDEVFYFRHFEGDKNSLLYDFFISAYRIHLGYYKGIRIEDSYATDLLYRGFPLLLQDFVAPFAVYLRGLFSMQYVKIDDEMNPSELEIETHTVCKVLGRKKRSKSARIIIDREGIKCFRIDKQQNTIEVTRR